MREWINIVENLSQDQISRAYQLISEYATYGEITENRRNHFDRNFEELMRILPRPTETFEVFRFLRLNDEQYNELKNGSLVLEMRKFSSWTKNIRSAELLAIKKQGSGNPVIVKAKFPSKDIVVDVADFYAENDFDNYEFSEYEKYVRPEQEIIIYHHGAIKLTPENTIFLDKEKKINPPMIGDRFFWNEDDEDGREIFAISDYQPYESRGLFYVTTCLLYTSPSPRD